MLQDDKTIVIVGAGQAGGTAAATLRQYGFKGKVVLIGDEPLLPYQRPPLSKTYLKTDLSPDALKLRAQSFYDEAGIELRLGRSVTAIDAKARTVALADGETLAYDILILATGSLVRKLDVPGAGLAGLFELRSQADADRLKPAVRSAKRIAIVGAGYVGLEVAASARALGAEVVVVERESRVLARVASAALSGFVDAYHRGRGVEILTGASVAAFLGDGQGQGEGKEEGKVRALQLADGRIVACDAVVVGVGALPCDALARSAGLVCDDGVRVDEQARTSDPAIYAIGDMTSRPLALYDGRRVRLESVPNALEQAKQAAASITGAAAPPPEIPWFWSDQYDLKLQMAGLGVGIDRTITRGSPETGKFALYHMSGDRVAVVESVNLPIEFITAKTLLTTKRRIDTDALADIAVPIKSDRIFVADAPVV
ncbi:3-phenylpropionate/trans-cinnamate dioxygenase ferredoxin reductase subunit [Azospirillum oryzae]|uniref:3-phenylpropionate/trans-cinnamate dioxygenase ferredoxin reductase subunit n=1 Tax=Azospirillum oryzae TaxID=286727 RepID=A0A1X7ELY2_9PROT|nr:FAD-dependent oxidoreductase [Azospirillum oryzae]SMF35845.1 3-phenylpropionate/trans-cinnamate dioxygenase ferredoxin reductase subunit [Azospirillum oryzae]